MAKILIVDDSRTSRKILKELLQGAGHEIVGEGNNGEEGYLLYKELRPDVVTMDITMPVMNGLESLECIRKNFPEAKIVMVTAAGQREKMIEAVKEGAVDFISKPFEPEVVVKNDVGRFAANCTLKE